MTGHAAVHPDVIRDLFVAFSQLAHAHPVAILLPFVMFFFFKVIARPHADRPVSYFRSADLDSWPRHHELGLRDGGRRAASADPAPQRQAWREG